MIIWWVSFSLQSTLVSSCTIAIPSFVVSDVLRSQTNMLTIRSHGLTNDVQSWTCFRSSFACVPVIEAVFSCSCGPNAITTSFLSLIPCRKCIAECFLQT